MSTNLNNILAFIKLKKQYLKTIKDKNFYVKFQITSNSKKFNTIKVFNEYEDSLTFYTVSILFSKTNTFMHVTNCSGKLKFFYSAGSFSHSGKKKKLRLIVFKDFFKALVYKLKNFKTKPISLHFTNIGLNQYWILKRLKNKFFIKSVKIFNSYPYNGCRKRKVRRVKIRTKKLKY